MVPDGDAEKGTAKAAKPARGSKDPVEEAA